MQNIYIYIQTIQFSSVPNTGVIRSVEIKLHFSVIQNINEIAQSLNYRLDEMATKKNTEMEVVICVKPPGAHLLLCITIVFLGLLQITFIMDYLDPT